MTFSQAGLGMAAKRVQAVRPPGTKGARSRLTCGGRAGLVGTTLVGLACCGAQPCAALQLPLPGIPVHPLPAPGPHPPSLLPAHAAAARVVPPARTLTLGVLTARADSCSSSSSLDG